MCGTKSGFELRLRPLPAARQHPLPITEIVGGKLHGMPPRDTEAIPTPRTSERSHALSLLRPNSVAGGSGHTYPEARARRRGDRIRTLFCCGARVCYWHSRHPGLSDSPQERTFGQCPRLMSRHTSARAARSEPFRFFRSKLWLMYCAGRQPHREHRALARLAHHRHVAAHHARELARDGKAKPRPAEALSGRGIGPGPKAGSESRRPTPPMKLA